MRLVAIFLILLVSCGTRERSRKETLSQKSKGISVQRVELDSITLQRIISLAQAAKTTKTHRYIQIVPIDSTQPARLIEKRNGKIVRETIVENARLNESISKKDSTGTSVKNVSENLLQKSKKKLDSIYNDNEIASSSSDDLKRDNTILGKNINLLLWLIIIAIIAFIGWKLKLY